MLQPWNFCHRLFFLAFWTLITSLTISTAIAQIPSVTDTTFTPTPNAGHDFIEAPNETVNPANGSLSIRVGVPTVKHLGPHIPFNFAYDSSGVFYLASPTPQIQWLDSIGQLSQGGWSYTLPTLNIQNHPFTAVNTGSGLSDYMYTCDAFSDYVFQDANGGRQNLGLLTWDSTNPQCNPQGGPPGGAPVGNNQIPFSGLFPYLATTSTATFTPGVPNNVDVIDADGNDYSFGPGSTPELTTPCTTPAGCSGSSIVLGITDRNGNPWQGGVGVPTFGANPDTITVAGLSQPYSVSWTAVSAHFAVNMTFFPLNGQNNSHCQGTGSSFNGGQPTIQAVSAIQLPNGQSYTFDYANNPYGMVDKITYPTGAYVRYVWGLNPQAAFFSYNFPGPSNPIFGPDGGLLGYGPPTIGGTCEYEYDVPAILQRFVSYDGTSEVEEQDFSYGPTTWTPPLYSYQPVTGQWATKQTTVVTKDLVQHTQHQTIYSYVPATDTRQPNSPQPSGGIPVESFVQYFDNNGALLQTVNKTWQNERLLTSQVISLATTGNNFITSETDWQYNNNEMETEKDDYDFGSGARGTLLRKTVIPSYDTTDFAASRHIVDKPNSVQVLNLAGAVAAGVTYGYDGNGNLITRSNWLDQTGSNIVTTGHTYDSHGNLHTTLDSASHTTTYNYTDSPGNSCGGAYLGSIQYPTVNGITPGLSFTYNCTIGELTSATDENGQPTNYSYSDPFNRLTDVYGPPSPQNNDTRPHTQHSYVDGPNSSETVTDPIGVQTTTFYDGMGHSIEAELVTDPVSPVYAVTKYDGEGHVYQRWNPTRCAPPLGTSCSGEASFGMTTNSYDGLGRVKGVLEPDGSSTSTVYIGNSVLFTDEAQNTWMHTSDALGRLTNVMEPGALSTGYSYDTLGNLTGVLQSGTTGETSRTRSFTYDELSRLITSTNPETGLITYNYLNNSAYCSGDPSLPCSKTDARQMTTSYSYDALNRVTAKSQNNVPINLYYYDGALGAWADPAFTGTNLVGRLSFTRSFNPDVVGNCNFTSLQCDDEYYGYDEMGRLKQQVSGPPSEWGFDADFTYAHYDLAGNMSALIYPDGTGVAQTFDSAGRLLNVSSTAVTPVPYVSSISYLPSGAPQTIRYGNGVSENLTQNSRMQPCDHNAFLPTFSGGTMAFDKQYFYSSATGSPCAPISTNNGNIYQINDATNTTQGSGNYSQTFTYDNLNRIQTFLTGSMGGQARQQTFTYDSFGNIKSMASADPPPNGVPDPLSFAATYDSTNRMQASAFQCVPIINGQLTPQVAAGSVSGYDASGNTLCSGIQGSNARAYAWDAESRITQVYAQQNNSTYAQTSLYTYNASGNRIRADQTATGPGGAWQAPTFKEYTYFGGQVIGEKDQTENWTDYIYANGKKIVRAPNVENVLTISGYNYGTGDYNWFPVWSINPALTNYTVGNGDKLVVRQRQHGSASGGVNFDTRSSSGAIAMLGSDEDGDAPDEDPTPAGVWHQRVFDLSPQAGTTFVVLYFGAPQWTGAGAWSIDFADMMLYSAATQSWIQIQTEANPVTAMSYYTGSFNGGYTTNGTWTVGPIAATPGVSERYYLADHLGTTQMEFAGGGWPVWRGEFAPFGQELDTQVTTNHYKFTGKERDAESGLDYFGARYYASSMGRWMSPDWSAKYEPVPYAKLDNPQSLNLYAYVLNNPLSNRDDDGHTTDADKDKKLPAPDAQHNHTITVREVQGQGGNAFGHVTVQIDGGKEVGYGPKQDMTKTQIIEGKSVPGQVEPRADGVKTVDQVTINVTGDQAKAAQGAIDDRVANPGNYNLTNNNCAQFGTTVVNAAGGNAPNDIKPSSLVSDIRSQQYKANSTQTPTPAPQQHQPQ